MQRLTTYKELETEAEDDIKRLKFTTDKATISVSGDDDDIYDNASLLKRLYFNLIVTYYT